MGVATILEARDVVLMAQGEGKAKIVQKTIEVCGGGGEAWCWNKVLRPHYFEHHGEAVSNVWVNLIPMHIVSYGHLSDAIGVLSDLTFQNPITHECPASYIQAHPNRFVLIEVGFHQKLNPVTAFITPSIGSIFHQFPLSKPNLADVSI